MGSHPINLGLRFILEVVALIAMSIWGWKEHSGWIKYVLVIGLPILFAVIWGVFAVPDDPSRSGDAPVVTPGLIRLLIELGIFLFATWALYNSGYTTFGIVFGIIVIAHYVISYDRIIWLLSK